MFGSTLGNITGTLYFLYYQIIGILLIFTLLKKEKTAAKLLIGSTAGSLLLHWLPILFAFFFDFTITAHFLAVLATLPVPFFAFRHKNNLRFSWRGCLQTIRRHLPFSVAIAATFLLWCYLLSTHTIPLGEDGAIYTGQCTYGDMNMHLSFITSLANQETFPPDYSLFPGTRLSYPFLSAGISASIYLMGASLRYAYILPMLTAFLQVTCGVYLLAITLFGSRAKALLSYLMYFFNGGLGFIYFFDWTQHNGLQFSDIFTGFYTTPTNLVDYNIRWVNIIADILLPQRASLFGYAVLFPCIWLLHQAVFTRQKIYIYIAAVFAGALPMIHTHSFLGIGLISAAWLLSDLYRSVTPESKRKWRGGLVLCLFILVMCLLQYAVADNRITSQQLLCLGILGIVCCVLCGICFLLRYLQQNSAKELLCTWGIYLVIILVLALPQLLFWTFGHVSEGGFLRGHFNWGNQGDFYPWFYLKNLGLPFLLILGSICNGNKKSSHLLLPAAVIWFIAELIVFTPNTYDNNKLLYIAYLLLSLSAADYAVDLYKQLRHIKGCSLLAACFLFFSLFSGVLTLQREIVSEYQLYGTSHVELVKYVEENTNDSDVFLTNTRHNNELVSLTGRSIVCGADTFLYFHGIDTTERKEHVRLMYEAPLENQHLYELYDVSYIVVSSWERATYNIDESLFAAQYPLVFNYNEINLYQIK